MSWGTGTLKKQDQVQYNTNAALEKVDPEQPGHKPFYAT